MRCDRCGAQMKVLPSQKYHYKECGLDNVYLYNIELAVCEGCGGVEPIIPRIKLLHETIARAVALQPYPLRGADIRFLRKQHRFKAREWASLLRVDVSTISRWENDAQAIGPQADALIRYVYFRLFEQDGQDLAGPIAEEIAAATQTRRASSVVLIDAGNPAIYSYDC